MLQALLIDVTSADRLAQKVAVRSTRGIGNGFSGGKLQIPYCVTPKMMAEVAKGGPETIFLHDLPAIRGSEVLDEVWTDHRVVPFNWRATSSPARWRC